MMNVDLIRYGHNQNMNAGLWNEVEHFTLNENWGDPMMVSVHLVYHLDNFREYLDMQCHIHCAYELEGHSPTGYHPRGMAADAYFGLYGNVMSNKELLDLFMVAQRFPFNGIGLYKWWNHPGLHLDVRPLRPDQPRKFWWRDYLGGYHGLYKQEDISAFLNDKNNIGEFHV